MFIFQNKLFQNEPTFLNLAFCNPKLVFGMLSGIIISFTGDYSTKYLISQYFLTIVQII